MTDAGVTDAANNAGRSDAGIIDAGADAGQNDAGIATSPMHFATVEVASFALAPSPYPIRIRAELSLPGVVIRQAGTLARADERKDFGISEQGLVGTIVNETSVTARISSASYAASQQPLPAVTSLENIRTTLSLSNISVAPHTTRSFVVALPATGSLPPITVTLRGVSTDIQLRSRIVVHAGGTIE